MSSGLPKLQVLTQFTWKPILLLLEASAGRPGLSLYSIEAVMTVMLYVTVFQKIKTSVISKKSAEIFQMCIINAAYSVKTSFFNCFVIEILSKSSVLVASISERFSSWGTGLPCQRQLVLILSRFSQATFSCMLSSLKWMCSFEQQQAHSWLWNARAGSGSVVRLNTPVPAYKLISSCSRIIMMKTIFYQDTEFSPLFIVSA